MAVRALACGLAVPALCVLLLECGVNLFGRISVGGVPVTRSAEGVKVLETHAKQWTQVPVTIYVGPYLARFTRARLGAQLPVAQVQTRLLTLGQTGNLFADLDDLWKSRRGGLDLPWRVEIERDSLSARIRELRGKLERPPVPGVLLPDGNLVEGTPGLTINLLRAVDQITRGLVTAATELRIDTHAIAAPQPVRYARGMIDASQFTEAMSYFETKYRTGGAQSGRAHNIELAVRAIDGAVIEPGGEFSFNQTVGQRSYERGFEKAKELANRRVVDGVGGGVCQVAATLHAAAYLGGFALAEYRPHSRPSRYIELGLDTMVSWPQQDLRITNNYPFVVRVRAKAEDGLLQVQLEGSGKAHPVEWTKQIVSRVKPGVQRIEARSLADGQTQLIQEAIDGMTIRRRRTIYLPTGQRVEDSMLTYPPTDRIIAVGAGGTGTVDDLRALQPLEANDF